MRIVALAENTAGNNACGYEHGLCFYVETEKHKLLVDTGASDLFTKNAEKLGVDLTKVDTVILSHGHYDHCGGVPVFLKLNKKAKIYMQSSAADDYYGGPDPENPEYIGIARELKDSDRITKIDGAFRIDDELMLFTVASREAPISSANSNLKVMREGELIPDDFRHEQCLVVNCAGKKILFSGCAHNGIINIMEQYRRLFGGDPDIAISGFHMMKRKGYTKEDIRFIVHTAYELRKYKTHFYTCHCTGVEPYTAMKKILDGRLEYIHSGDSIEIIEKKRRKTFMKAHKFFAWAAVFCFIMTMVTGYKRK